MARGGLSSDPEKRERQLAALAKGKAVAAERRAKGLPTKRTEARAAAVRDGAYPGATKRAKPAGSSSTTRSASAAPKKPKQAKGAGLGRIERAYGKLLGYDV